MGFSKISEDDHKKLRSEMHKGIDTFCDQLICQDVDQAQRGIEQLKTSINEAALDTIIAHCENNQHTVAKALPSPPCVNEEPPGPFAGLRGQSANKPESTPLLPEQQQELRNRVLSRVSPGQKPGPERDSEPEGSQNQSPGAQKTGKSFCEEVLGLFQEMLSQLQKTWLDVLVWVQESLVNVVKFILSEIVSFCSSAARSFSSLFLVQGVA